MNISNNVSSIQAHQTMLSSSANNIANANTYGFVPVDTKIANESTLVKASVRLTDKNQTLKSQTDLTKELPNQIIAQDTISVNVSSIKTTDEMIGTLLDMKA